ncbi:MAG: FAD/NAD(P)-binding protein [Alphaproteobacteria bacterium]|nr:FAD/NAD(P)-binding protein [Alphaproteobacteria bacterium]
MPQKSLNLAVIGGGAVGVTAVCNAVMMALETSRRTTIFHFEHQEPVAEQAQDGVPIATGGIAYNRAAWEMKVNRQVKEMGLFPTHDELHLLKWLETSADRSAWPEAWRSHTFTENDFLPRPIVDQYVRQCYLGSLQSGALFSDLVTIHPLREEVTDIQPNTSGRNVAACRILTADHHTYAVHHVLAACGQFRNSTPEFAESVETNPAYIGYLWERNRDRPETDPAKTVLTVGTGLGGMDVMRSRWFKAGIAELLDVLEHARDRHETRALLEGLADKYGFESLRRPKDLAPTYRRSQAATENEKRQIIQGLIDAGELQPMVLTSRHLNLHFAYEEDFVAHPLPLPPVDLASLPTDIDQITEYANRLIEWTDREVVGKQRFGKLTWEDILWTVQPYIPMLLARVEPNQTHLAAAHHDYDAAKTAAQRELLDRFHSFLTTHHIGMPKETIDIYDKMTKYGLLIPVAGQMQDILDFGNGLNVLIEDSQGQALYEGDVDAVINAIQPNSDITHPANQNHLLARLAGAGLARAHKWRLGIEVDEHMHPVGADGRPVTFLTVISGASMVGSLFEQFGLLTFAASLEVSAWITAQAVERVFGRTPAEEMTAVNKPEMFAAGAEICLPGRVAQKGNGCEFWVQAMNLPDASQLRPYWRATLAANGTSVDVCTFTDHVTTHPVPRARQ